LAVFILFLALEKGETVVIKPINKRN